MTGPSRSSPSVRARTAWAALAAPSGRTCERFDPASLDDLPAPAQRLLANALPAGASLSPVVRLRMGGEIKLGGRWLDFTAQQIVRNGVGFVWAPVVGGRVIRFTGADVLRSSEARLEFRFHGRIPVVRASGPDIHRSAQGRLAAETVAWLPQALTPQAGAQWAGIDDERAVVTLDVAGAEIDVKVAVDTGGRLRWIGLDRWNSSARPPAFAPFGGPVTSVLAAPDGVRIAGSGAVGWDWHTPAEGDGVFFRYRIVGVDFAAGT